MPHSTPAAGLPFPRMRRAPSLRPGVNRSPDNAMASFTNTLLPRLIQFTGQFHEWPVPLNPTKLFCGVGWNFDVGRFTTLSGLIIAAASDPGLSQPRALMQNPFGIHCAVWSLRRPGRCAVRVVAPSGSGAIRVVAPSGSLRHSGRCAIRVGCTIWVGCHLGRAPFGSDIAFQQNRIGVALCGGKSPQRGQSTSRAAAPVHAQRIGVGRCCQGGAWVARHLHIG